MSAEQQRDDLERARELVGAWRRSRAEGTHLSPFGLHELEGRIVRLVERVRAEAVAAATEHTGARVVEAWRDRPVRSRVGENELAELVWLIDETLLGARQQAVLEDRARRSSTPGDELVIDESELDDERWSS